MGDVRVWVLLVLLLVLWVEYELLRKSEARAARIIAKFAGGAFAVVFTLLVLILRPQYLESAIIPSDSMYPTLHIGDRLFINKAVYKRHGPKHGEVITFDAAPDMTKGIHDFWIKRVIGLPGDVVEIKDGAVYRNGKRLNEPYIRKPIQYTMEPVTVPRGMLFVLGDNRNNSCDSHEWGPLDRRRVTGRAGLRFWPLSRMGWMK